MLDLGYLSVDNYGQLVIDGVSSAELVSEFGTPLYVMSERIIRRNCETYKSAIDKYYDGKGMALYASKAMMCKEMCRIMKSEGFGLDVVSSGELYTAIKSGFPAENIHFHGNNKTLEEINLALEYKVGRIVVDNFDELQVVDSFARGKGVTQKILLRIKPGVNPHTHSSIKTGQIDSKFGFTIENDEAIHAANVARDLKNVELMGVHCHIGSQIANVEPFKKTAEVMMGFVNEVKQRLSFELKELNLGGGYAIRYTEKDEKINFDDYLRQVLEIVKTKADEFNLKRPYVYFEPGREIVGEAGVTLYQVGGVKEIPNVRTYVSIDGGMTDNPRYALYGSEYTVLNASKLNKIADSKVTIAGKCCESGDIIQKDVEMKFPQAGDIITVLCTGAYNYSMASNYNRIPVPAVVMIKNGEKKVIVKRQTLNDIISKDV